MNCIKNIQDRENNVANDYCFRVGSVTSVLGRPAVLYRSNQLHSAGMAFASVYGVTEQDAKALTEAGTVAGFKGTVWSQRLWVDFDNESAATLGRARLKEMGLDHVVYTTGGRGCHIGILRDNAPSHLLPLQDKLWAANNLPGCDLGLYWHLHLIRLPGTVHERTGLPKRLLYRVPGRELTLPPYDPSAGLQLERPLGAMERREGLFQVWEVITKLVDPAPVAGRHRHLVSLAKTLKDRGDVSSEEALWLLTEVNRGFGDIKGSDEIERVIRWAYE